MNEAKKLIEDVLRSYRSLDTYQDDGSVTVRGDNLSTRTTFDTRFMRPSYFRFRFASPHPYAPLAHVVTTCVCGFDGNEAYLWRKHHEDTPVLERQENLLIAVAGATGVSSGSAHTIAQLLLEGFDGEALLSLEGVTTVGTQAVEETMCQLVRGKFPRAEAIVTLLIDPDRKLVHQVTTEFAAFTSVESRQNIRLNAPLDAGAFCVPQ